MAFFARSQSRPIAATGVEPATQPSPLAYVPPSTRELRAQAVHRLQVGMFGLAGMLLLVSLANVIMDRAKYVDATAVNTAAPTVTASETTANDPLVDMGVAPELPVASKDKPAARPVPTRNPGEAPSP